MEKIVKLLDKENHTGFSYTLWDEELFKKVRKICEDDLKEHEKQSKKIV